MCPSEPRCNFASSRILCISGESRSESSLRASCIADTRVGRAVCEILANFLGSTRPSHLISAWATEKCSICSGTPHPPIAFNSPTACTFLREMPAILLYSVPAAMVLAIISMAALWRVSSFVEHFDKSLELLSFGLLCLIIIFVIFELVIEELYT